MLLRKVDTGWIAITQPAHARLSAQIAAAWDAEWAAPVTPRDGVVAGTLLHDIGWLDWESSPTLNPETGLPHTFLQLSVTVHIGMWRTAAQRALAFGRYPALLTSMHGTRLYGSRDLSSLPEGDAALIREFLADEAARQGALIDSLRAEPSTAASVEAEQLAVNSQYVALWDAMSLAICGGIRDERSFNQVPSDGEASSIRVLPENGRERLRLDPWPFRDAAVSLTFDARHIGSTFNDEEQMRRALNDSVWIQESVELVPGP
ncbi:MAG: DUF3891 family protein [Thermomicrobiales bacterium]|nr:DUF3891 family protein [Thermomicrobiales bacterium]